MGSKRKRVDYDDDDSEDSRGEEEAQPDLERSIKELYQEEDADDPLQADLAQKAELISKLEQTRQEDASRKLMARRIAWREEVRKELERSAEFRGIMESVPLEDVEAEQKPMMSRMSMKCREAFKSERAGFLFPQVLSTFLKLKLTSGPDPKILRHRLVCKSAKESVDAILSSEQFFTQIRIEESPFYIPRCYYNALRISEFYHEVIAEVFIQRFGHAVNPFFTRAIHIFACKLSSPELWKEIQVILRRWGKELWAASFLFDESITLELGYDLLVSWLKLMPNLRVIGIKFKNKTLDFSKLVEHIAKDPLPDMPSLARIIMSDSSNPGPLAHAMLSKFNSVLDRVALDCSMGCGDRLPIEGTVSNCAPPAAMEGSFSNLRELHVCYRFMGSVADVRKIIKNFNNWRLPLKRLGLELHNKGIEGGQGYGPMFLLNNKVLTSKGVFLEMPLLEELSLIMYYRFNLRTFDFLLPCKALKVLSFRNIRVETNAKPRRNQQGPPEDKGIFQFTADPADKDLVYRSPIWKLLPELKQIVLTTVSIKKDGAFQKAECKQYMEVGKPETRKYTREKYLQCSKERGNGRSEL